jgi:uncharacterized membrane protein
MDPYTLLKVGHVIGAAVLLGTGAGIAFFMVMAHRTREPALVAHIAGIVVIADAIFTATAVVLQPVTGIALAHISGFPLLRGWIGLSLALYVVAGACWLPVVFIQIGMRNLAREAALKGQPLPGAYFRLFRLWFALGFPAFAAVIAIIWLMVVKPSF